MGASSTTSANAANRGTEPVRVFNRYTRSLETEPVYGESWLRWAYNNPLGRLSVWALASRRFFSRFYGWRMNRPDTRSRIAPFVESYGLDATEFDRSPESYESFNAFFSRRLKAEARPIESDPRQPVFPADGRHLGFQDYAKCDGILVKGKRFFLEELLGNTELYRFFKNGVVVISRLAPIDYHRFHFALGGEPGEAELRPGGLYSVNPIALRRNIHYLSRNRRMITEIRNDTIGMFLQIEVGATNVGSIEQTYRPHEPVEKGAEKGYFAFGGSTVITLFPPGSVRLADDLLEQTGRYTELYARMGDAMGTLERTRIAQPSQPTRPSR